MIVRFSAVIRSNCRYCRPQAWARLPSKTDAEMPENRTNATTLSVTAYIDARPVRGYAPTRKNWFNLCNGLPAKSRNFGDRPLLASAAITTNMTAAVKETCGLI